MPTFFHKNSKTLIALSIIGFTLFGFYLRAKGTVQEYFPLTYDQGKDLIALSEIVSGDLRLIGPISAIDGVFHGVWWYWLMTPLFLIARGDPKTLVLLFNFLSSLLIPLSFLLGTRLKNTWLGLFYTAIVTVSPFFISAGAQLWHPNLVHLFIEMLFLSYLAIKNVKLKFFSVGLFLGLVVEFGLGFGLLFFCASIVGSVIVLQKKVFSYIKKIPYVISGLFIAFLPRFIFDLKHNFIQSQSALNYFLNQQNFSETSFLSRLVGRFQLVKELILKTLAVDNNGLTYLYCALFISLLVLFVFKNEVKKSYAYYLVTLILSIVFISALQKGPVWNYYFNGIGILLVILLGYLLFFLFWENKKIVILVTSILIFFSNLYYVSIVRPPPEDGSVYKIQKKILTDIYADVGSAPYNVVVYTPSVIDYTYNYLFVWYGKSHSKIIPNREKTEKIVYFIIEPDNQNIKIKEAWLRDREGDGTIEWQREYEAGIIVQKRVRS